MLFWTAIGYVILVFAHMIQGTILSIPQHALCFVIAGFYTVGMRIINPRWKFW